MKLVKVSKKKTTIKKYTIIKKTILKKLYIGERIVIHDRKAYEQPMYTPEHITHLHPNEVFVFGSNLEGHHGGGAAHIALNHFEA